MLPKPWSVISSSYDERLSVFTLRTDRARSPRTGEAHDFFILETPSWVNIIPLTKEDEVVMIRQWRHGIGQVTLEIPGGVIEPADTPLSAARRELSEETGYEAEQMISLGFIYPNPAIQNTLCYTFLARNVTCKGEQNLDDKEDIQILHYPLSDIPEMIKKGEIRHSLIIAAFWRLFMEYRDLAR
ncbi:MAG: NUDIX hydrolase [Syntrophales bacterium]|jgi:8-oxo-dGTP pyrophosphatase MutT (NUDIX family)|nr:NUDIX hydrolase [Syntrophales bacterium]MDY0045239.1 NUDIX hydrolase [Syntrophales bacterium]